MSHSVGISKGAVTHQAQLDRHTLRYRAGSHNQRPSQRAAELVRLGLEAKAAFLTAIEQGG